MVKHNCSLLRRVGLVAGVVCGCALSLSSASAMSLVIESCDGVPRLSKDVSEGQSVDVTLEGIDVSKSSEVQLVDLDGVSVARSEQGVDEVTFRDVKAGTYRVCGAQLQPVGFQSAKIITEGDSLAGAAFASSGVGAGALALGGVLGGAAIALSDSDSGSSRGGALGIPGSSSSPIVGEAVSSPVTVGGVDFDEDDFGFGAPGLPLSPAS